MGFPRTSKKPATNAPTRKRIVMDQKTAQPWRVLPVIVPSVYVSPAPTEKIRNISTRLLKGVGFSYGWAAFALKKPPPFVPRFLITSCEAMGPCGIFWVAPSSVVTVSDGLKFWMTPCDIRTTAPARLIGRSTQRVARTRSDQKLPMPFASTRATPLTKAIAMVRPVAADAKLWTARPAIWVKSDIVDSPE